MKKIIMIIGCIIALGTINANAAIGDLFATGTNSAGDNAVTVGSDGVLNAKIGITNSYPMFNPQCVFLAPATASNTAYKNTTISTATLVAAVTTFTLANGDYTDIITPRNIVIVSSISTPSDDSATYTGSALVTGINAKGESTTETITVTKTGGTGVVAWSSITSIALTTTATNANTLKIQVGSGVKIGLPANLSAAGEVLKVIENGGLTTTYTLNTTYDTITFVNAPDTSKNYIVYLKPTIR